MGTTLSGFAAVAAIGLVLVTGCAGESSPARGKQQVRPSGDLVPATGGGDVPESTLALCRECQRRLERGENEVLEQRMSAVALQQQAIAGRAAEPSDRAVALACAGAARTNLGRYDEAIVSLEKAEAHMKDLPAGTRGNFAELIYHAQLISYTATGRTGRAQRALSRLAATGRDTAVYVEQACAIGGTAQALPECRPEERRSPTGQPETTGTGSAPAEPPSEPPSGSPSEPPSGPSSAPSAEPEPEPPVDTGQAPDPGPGEDRPDPEPPPVPAET